MVLSDGKRFYSAAFQAASGSSHARLNGRYKVNQSLRRFFRPRIFTDRTPYATEKKTAARRAYCSRTFRRTRGFLNLAASVIQALDPENTRRSPSASRRMAGGLAGTAAHKMLPDILRSGERVMLSADPNCRGPLSRQRSPPARTRCAWT